jgi:hypothetical protein
MPVPETFDGFRATTYALLSPDGVKGVSFLSPSLPENRSLRLLLKNLGNRTTHAGIREELKALHINVQVLKQFRPKPRDQDPEKDSFLTSDYGIGGASSWNCVIDLCGLRVNVDTYRAPKGPLRCKRCYCFGNAQPSCYYAPRCVVRGIRTRKRAA